MLKSRILSYCILFRIPEDIYKQKLHTGLSYIPHSEVIQNRPNCENNLSTEVDQNLPNSEVYCTKTTVTTMQVTVPDLGIEETSTDIPQVTADAQDNVFSEVTKEAEYTTLRLEGLSCPSEIENRDIAESQKPLVDLS